MTPHPFAHAWQQIETWHGSRSRIVRRAGMVSGFLVAAVVICSELPARAQVPCDSELADTDWADTLIVDSGNNSTFTSSQSTTGGNAGAYRQTVHTFGPGVIRVAHQRLGWTYYPMIDGQISSIDTNWDLIHINPPAGAGVAYSLLVYQDGAYYMGPHDQIFATTWTSFSQTALVPTDFTKVAGNASAPPTPDFSCAGASIDFGYITSNSNNGTVVRDSGIDNWCITLHVGPCVGPCPGTNPVVNWSFEALSSCPSASGQIPLAPPWGGPTAAPGEYFHSCGTAPFSVPTNAGGNQPAHTGNGYAGLFAYNFFSTNYRSYIEAPLGSSLVAGRLYDVSFWLSLADISQQSCDSVAGLLKVGSAGPVANTLPLPFTPQITSPAGTPVDDKLNWTRVHHVFRAVGGEDHLIIGNFLDDTTTSLTSVAGGSFPVAYYFVDDVSVCEADPICTCGTPTWSDTFDSYAPASIVNGNGTWDALCGSSTGSMVSSNYSVTQPHSVAVASGDDLLQTFQGYSSGRWVFHTMQYLPSATFIESTWLRILHFHAGSCFPYSGAHQSVELEFDPVAAQWKLYEGCNVVSAGPLFFDQWVEVRAEIDLDADLVRVFYGGTQMAPTTSYFSAGSCPFPAGPIEIQAAKFSSNGVNPSSKAYYDCIALTPYRDPVTVTVVAGGPCGVKLLPTDKVKPVAPNDVVEGILPNALAHSLDSAGRVASYLRVSFIDRNPTTGASSTYSTISPPGGPDTVHCLTLLPVLSGTYEYDAEVLDQDFDLLCSIDPTLVAGTLISTYCTAGTSTNGCVPTISAVGTPSVAASSGFPITVSNLEGQKQGLIFYGISGQHSSPWGSGGTSFLCVKAPTQRLGTQSSGGTANSCDGSLSQDWSAYLASHMGALGKPFSAGTVVNVQGWYRDPPAVKTTNLSNALEFTTLP